MFQNKIKDIFFDLDHTLWDFDKNSKGAFGVILKKHYPSIDIEKFIELYVPINQECWKLYQKDIINHETLRYRRLKQTFDAINYPITDPEIDIISNLYIELLPDFNSLFENTHETLTYLKQHYNLHIITNGFAKVQDKKMVNANINHYFTTITNSEMAGAKKPSPIIFDYALQAAGASKEHSVMIGDCLDADIGGAINYGMQAIFFNPNEIKNIANLNEITNLAQLKKIL